MISQLLQQNQFERLGTGGAHEVKGHAFFQGIDWDACLRQKAEFVPQLEDEDDTSYFDTRTDRYNHELEDSEEQETDDSSMFSSFSSCSPRYHKVYSRIEKELAQERLLKSSSTSSIADESVSKPSTPESSLLRTKSLNEGRTTPILTVESAMHKSLANDDNSTECSPIDTKEASKCNVLSAPDLHKDQPDDGKSHEKPRIAKCSLPRFSISVDVHDTRSPLCPPSIREIPPAEEGATDSPSGPPLAPTGPHTASRVPILNAPPSSKSHKSRAVIKSASASGLSLIIPAPDDKGVQSTLIASPVSSASSRDTSPNRENAALGQLSLKPPIIIRKGARGFGFTLKAIRVYYGDSDVYTYVLHTDAKCTKDDFGCLAESTTWYSLSRTTVPHLKLAYDQAT